MDCINDWITSRWNAFWQRQIENITHLGTNVRALSAAQSFSVWLLTPAVTFTNSRPVAAHRGKQAVTKTNEGGSRGGRACGEVGWTSLSISELHFQFGGPAAEPAGLTSSHHLSDCWGELMAPAQLLMNLFVSASARSAPSGGVFKQTCPLNRLPS